MAPCNVLLIAPAFPNSTFWRLGETCAVVGARHTQPPLGLMTVASMLPPAWACRLVDRNVSRLTDEEIGWADLVMTGGMNVQRSDCLALVERVQRLGKCVVVGGPDVTSQPDAYAEADFVVCGEAEGIIGDFIAAWEAGHRRGTFVAEKATVDITRSPLPRFDLVQRQDYLHFAIQFSRGCPFTCEFCDIIELYGRVPRVKSVEQFLGEIEALYSAGYRGHLDFVDDNFIGNKKAVKRLLPVLIDWQQKRQYPFWFTTEASLNLADDAELLALMRRANFAAVFVGIESPDAATLVATRKKQNARHPIAESVRRIHDAGLLVAAGFIVGFDSEVGWISPAMTACIEDSAIPICMPGLLTALPNTQLHRRLEREGRLYEFDWFFREMKTRGGDQCTLGLNFETRRPRREVLADYRSVLDAVFVPKAYFSRVRVLLGRLQQWPPHGAATMGRPRWQFLGVADAEWRTLSRLLLGAVRAGPATLVEILRLMLDTARTDPGRLHLAGTLAAFYLHLGPFARRTAAVMSMQIEAIDRGEWKRPPLASTATDAPPAVRGTIPALPRSAAGRRPHPADAV